MRRFLGERRGFYAALRDGLIAFAEYRFALDRKDAAGAYSEREHLEGLAARTGRRVDLGPELPPAAAHLWRWFLELHGARGGTGFGPAPIGFPDIAAWAALTGARPRPWEVRVIKALDALWMAARGDK